MIKDKLDLKDRKILYQLDLDCRQTDSQIGKKIQMSKQTVAYRINRLLKEKYITRFATVIDTYRLGYSKYKIYLSFENANKETIEKIITYLKSHKKTEWVATCSGKWDVIVGFIVKDIYEFEEISRNFYEKFSKYISSGETLINLGVPHWRKEYLLDNKTAFPVITQGNTSSQIKIDEIDEKIIKLLVNNARMPITEMAHRLKLTPKIVNYRIKNLEKHKIILVKRIFLDLNKFNWIYCKALLKFKGLTKERYAAFFKYCNSLKNLTYIINCVGSWDIELDFEIEDFNTFHTLMLDLKDKFFDIIKNYDFAIVMNEDKLDYYPESYEQFSF